MDERTWFWRNESRLRDAARWIGLAGSAVFLVSFFVLLRGAFDAGNWLFWLAGVSFPLFCLALAVGMDDARDAGYRAGFRDGQPTEPGGSDAPTRSRAVARGSWR